MKMQQFIETLFVVKGAHKMENYLLEIVRNEDTFWTDSLGQDSDVVLSTRVRIARNYKKYPFSQKINEEQSRELIDELAKLLVKEDDLYFFDLSFFSEELKMALLEKQLISKDLVGKKLPTGLVLNKENNLSIMLNEEDHLRIQAYANGLDFESSLKRAIEADELFSSLGDYAFDKDLGFYTSCPTNFGTGLRASIMVHLPGITEMGMLPQLNRELQKAGYILRGMYGDQTESWGSFFQISNQLTTGISEEEIIKTISLAAKNLVRQEREIRGKISKDKKLLLEDKVFRAWGLLTNARVLSQKEAILNISMLRMGLNENIIGKDSDYHKNLSLSDINKLVLFSGGNYLKTINKKRSEKIREVLI